jgi:hypothetical protein
MNPISSVSAEQADHFTLLDLEIYQRIERILDQVRASLDKRDVFTVDYCGTA